MAQKPASPPLFEDPISPITEDPQSPIYNDIEKAENANREYYGNTKSFVAANTKSNITPQELQRIREEYQIPEQYDLQTPLSSDKMYFRADMRYLAVHTQALRYGLRFPLHDFINTFFTLTGISPSQLLPNSYIHLISFIAFCHEVGTTPSTDFFFSIFTLTKTREPGFRCLNKIPGRRAWIQTPTTNKGWHAGWFYIHCTDIDQLSSWGEPLKFTLGFEHLSSERKKEFFSFCNKIPTEPWDIELLSNNQWLYDHGRKFLVPFALI